jgi:hypothetical protein
MRKGELSKLARVKVDIPNTLDNLWTLDIKKSVAIPPESVRKNLSNIIGRIAESSKRTWQFRGKKEVSESNNKIWVRNKLRDDAIYYGLNRENPLIDNIIKNSNEKRMLETLILAIEKELPLNQIFVDLSNDEKFNNDSQVTKNELNDLIKNIFSQCKDEFEINDMRVLFKSVEPYNLHSELIDSIAEEAKMNAK